MTLSLVQLWLNTRNVTVVVQVLDASVVALSSKCSPCLLNLPRKSKNRQIPHNPLNAAVILACTPLSTILFPCTQLSIIMLAYSTLLTVALTIFGLSSLWSVLLNVCWTTVKSEVFLTLWRP
ncbi:hypothetical protein XENOCAPTIV_001993 [Xenoophorus captivus]|uniref:Uncharacterized protein n=1 Tax=Xenoophorus captivus TaxID=1517983 RepID=A0ABV0QPD0_9TELE